MQMICRFSKMEMSEENAFTARKRGDATRLYFEIDRLVVRNCHPGPKSLFFFRFWCVRPNEDDATGCPSEKRKRHIMGAPMHF